MEQRITFIDIETGGLEFTRPIIQIAAIAVDSEFQERERIEIKVAFDFRKADPDSLPFSKFKPTFGSEKRFRPRRQRTFSQRSCAVTPLLR